MSFEMEKPNLAKAQYQHFIGLYRQVKQDGLESHTFNQLLRDMYEADVIAPFDYTDWQTARAPATISNSACSIAKLPDMDPLLPPTCMLSRWSSGRMPHEFGDMTTVALMRSASV